MRCTISQIYIGTELYIFRTDLLFVIRSLVLYTQQDLTITTLPGNQFTVTPQKTSVAKQEYTQFDTI